MRWFPGVLAALVATSMIAMGTATAATPRVVAGWPQLAPPAGDAFAVPDGPVLVTNGMRGWEGGEAVGFSRSGLRRWSRTVGRTCGNCGAAPTPVLSPTGILGPIGFHEGGLHSFDVAGNEVPACAGAIGGDGDCYSLSVEYRGPMQPPVLHARRAGHWDVTGWGAAVSSYEMPASTFAFTADTVIVGVHATPWQVAAFDRGDGRLLWTRETGPSSLRPVVSGDGAVHLTGPGDVVRAVDARTGLDRWQADVGGTPTGMLAEGGGAGVVVAVRRRGPVAVVRLDATGRVDTVIERRPEGTRLLAVGADGTSYLAYDAVADRRTGILAAVDTRGRTRWSFEAPALFGTGAGTPAVVGRDVFVAIGPLMYRLRPPAASATPVAVPARARLSVAPSRFRATGEPRVCPTGGSASCVPAAPLGTVARLSLPRSAAGARATATLVPVGARGRSVSVGSSFTARPGTQWLAVAPPDNEFSYWSARTAPRPRPGAHRLVVRWSGEGSRGAVSAPVSVVR